MDDEFEINDSNETNEGEVETYEEVETSNEVDSISVCDRKLLKIVSYMGGKMGLLNFIYGHFPKRHEGFIDVFAGSGAVSLNKEPSKLDVYNDFDKRMFNLFKVIQNEFKFEKFNRMINTSIYSRSEFYDCRKRLKENKYEDDVQKAYDTFVIFEMGFGGKPKTNAASFGYVISLGHRIPYAYFRNITRVEKIHNRMKTVIVENLDFRDIIKRYSCENNLFYCDPPYFKNDKKVEGYEIPFSENDHKELVDLIIEQSKKSLFLISGYNNEIYEKLMDNGFKKDTTKKIVSCKGITVQTKGEKTRDFAEETVWFNYDVMLQN